jgi:hypothetical protein
MIGCIYFFIFYETYPWNGRNQNQMLDLMKARKDLIANSDFDPSILNKVPIAI